MGVTCENDVCKCTCNGKVVCEDHSSSEGGSTAQGGDLPTCTAIGITKSSDCSDQCQPVTEDGMTQKASQAECVNGKCTCTCNGKPTCADTGGGGATETSSSE